MVYEDGDFDFIHKYDKYSNIHFLSNGIHANGKEIIFIIETICFNTAKDFFKERKLPSSRFLRFRD